ncbi:hypothetical protein EDC04DRAFT_2616860 [Pisolithus marmoratus]|nr:hypothetical protein EDC04DRAFT_2616860 [Pisolithus marmoratus]
MPPRRKRADTAIHSPDADSQTQKPRAKGSKTINLPAPNLQPVSPVPMPPPKPVSSMPMPAPVLQLVSPVPMPMPPPALIIIPLAACSQPIPQKMPSAPGSLSSAENFDLNVSSSDESNCQTQQASSDLEKPSQMTSQVSGGGDENDDDHSSFTGLMLTSSSREREKASSVKKKVAKNAALDIKHFFLKTKDDRDDCMQKTNLLISVRKPPSTLVLETQQRESDEMQTV